MITTTRTQKLTAQSLPVTEWYREDDGGNAEIQRWWGAHDLAPAEPDPGRWVLLANDFGE